MLQRIRVRNFQAHEDKAIDLDPRLTVLVGPSDVGKSAFLRAFRWVATNRPAGEAFLRYGADRVDVEVVVDDHTITRGRGKGGNTYTIDGKPLEAFGTTVPDEVARLLNMGDLNWQGQHDGPFWLAETSGEVSRQLNAVVNLSIMDDALGYLAGQVRNGNALVEVVSQRLSQAMEQKHGLRWVALCAQDWEDVATHEEEARIKRSTAATLGSLLQEVRQHQTARDRATAAATAGLFLVDRASVAGKARQRAARVRALAADIKSTQQKAWMPLPDMGVLEHAKQRAEQAAARAAGLRELLVVVRRYKAEAERVLPDVSGLNALAAAAANARQQHAKLDMLLTQIKQRTRTQWQSGQDLEAATLELHRATAGQSCPTCGQQLPTL